MYSRKNEDHSLRFRSWEKAILFQNNLFEKFVGSYLWTQNKFQWMIQDSQVWEFVHFGRAADRFEHLPLVPVVYTAHDSTLLL